MVRIGDKEGIERGHNLGTKLTFTSEPPTLTPMSFGQDVVNELFKEIRSATASPSDRNRSQLPNKALNETDHKKQR